ncbi:hypothetical protein DRE_01339 [Drechslerella stenobrocha 248]|uniref:Thioesterase domain-containing protein n=1 Tax=Drechslerella stenobrocha 248 TaxID=1043628 RepID=W7HVB9_9PEZI|nr:hypothetical protein DRE_01339 [Drechslerella stenobrocha 248]
MASALLPRSLLRASRSTTFSRLALVEQPLRNQGTRQRLCAARLNLRSISSSHQRNQYQTHTYDIGDGSPPVKVQIQEPPSFIRRVFRLTARAVGGVLIVTIGSVIALMAVEPSMIIATGEVRMATLPQEGVSDEHTLEVEHYLQTHPFVEKLRRDGNFIEKRAHIDIPAMFRPRVFTAGVLAGPGRLTVPPLMFSDPQGRRFYSIMHVGDEVFGHPEFLHGGFLATLLDEGLARCAFPNSPNGAGITANLNINYRSPCPGNRFIIIKAETTKLEGRKAWVSGRLELLPEPNSSEDGKLLVEATSLMIEPRSMGPLTREVTPST